MATLLGGDRWNDEITPLDDDWYAYKCEQESKEDPLDDDYTPEKYRANKGATLKTNYDNLHSMTLDELATWIDKHGDFDGAPWMKWFDANYCKNCESIEVDRDTAIRVLRLSSFYSSGVTCAYCELHHNCKFFPELDYIPDNKDIIRMWLELEAEEEY